MRAKQVTTILLLAALVFIAWRVSLRQISIDGSPREKFDSAVAIIQQFANEALKGRIPPPKGGIILIAVGQTIAANCAHPETDMSLDYCPRDDAIYAGESILRTLDRHATEFGLSHEFGHHIELVLGMYTKKLTQQELENRADCIGGAITAHTAQGGFAASLRNERNSVSVNLEGDSDHGTSEERKSWLQLGASKGVRACVDL